MEEYIMVLFLSANFIGLEDVWLNKQTSSLIQSKFLKEDSCMEKPNQQWALWQLVWN